MSLNFSMISYILHTGVCKIRIIVVLYQIQGRIGWGNIQAGIAILKFSIKEWEDDENEKTI
jgi:hypothetical protein